MKTEATRRLRLSVETLRVLEGDQLRKAAGGALTNTCNSCLDFVSCDVLQCVVNKVSTAFADGCGPA